eukprot:366257-Chlamydomonas_euryale.AAC.3
MHVLGRGLVRAACPPRPRASSHRLRRFGGQALPSSRCELPPHPIAERGAATKPLRPTGAVRAMAAGADGVATRPQVWHAGVVLRRRGEPHNTDVWGHRLSERHAVGCCSRRVTG